jgi:PST family polysaccharide transporter
MSRKLLKSAGLFASAELFSKLINFGSFAALAIWLTPEEYGLFAIAWLAFIAADAFFDLGGGISFFREDNDAQSFRRFRGYVLCTGAFWFSVELAIAGVFYLSGRPDISVLVSLLALSLLPRIPLAAAQGWWKANFLFERSAAILVINAIAGSAAAILAASQGMGEIALALRFVAGVLVSGIIALLIEPGLLTYAFCKRTFKRWATEGFKFSLTSNWGWLVFFYIEQQIILYLMGTSALGVYNYAKKVVEITLQALASITRATLLPYMIKRGVNSQKLLKYTGISLLPLVLGVGVVQCVLSMPEFSTMVGGEWADVITIAAIVVWVLPAGFVATILSNYLVSAERYRALIIVELAATILLLVVGSIAFVCEYDLTNFTLGIVGIQLVKALLVVYLTYEKTPVSSAKESKVL